MATEVSVKLISLSLGKIQQSRQIKSGLNLRKSLLVASVLHKAKDIYMTEIRTRPKFGSQKSVVESNSQTADKGDSESIQDDMDTTKDQSTNLNSDSTSIISKSPNTQDYEAETAAAAASISCDSILDELANESEQELNKENSPPAAVTASNNNGSDSKVSDALTSTRVESLSCRPCLKRRSSHFDTDIPTTVNDSETDSTTKKARVEAPSLSHSSTTGQSYESQPDTGNQINSLVHIFSAGFSAFGNHTADSTNGYDDNSHSDSSSNSSTSTSCYSTELSTFTLCRESIALTA